MSKFKVGDRIRVYYPDCVENIGTVREIVNENLLRWKNDRDIPHDGYSLYSAHPKQCRRLVKRKKLYCVCSDLIRVFDVHEPNRCIKCLGEFKPGTLGIDEDKLQALTERVKMIESFFSCPQCKGWRFFGGEICDSCKGRGRKIHDAA